MNINSSCRNCKQSFSIPQRSFGIYTKCNHFTHIDNECFSIKCLICNDYCSYISPIKNVHNKSFKELYSLRLDRNMVDQNYINSSSIIRNIPSFTYFDRINGLYRLIKLFFIIISLLFTIIGNNKNTLFDLINFNQLIKLLNINITCSIDSKNKLNDSSVKKIIIANHTNYHDLLIIASLLQKSEYNNEAIYQNINKMSFTSIITKIIPNILMHNGITHNITENIIYDTLLNYDKILVFPEEMFTHHLTLCKFNSNIFKTKYHIQPIIIRYKQNIYDLMGFDILCNPKIDVEIKVLDIIENNNSEESIENIRKIMAEEGKLLLSNVKL